MPSKGFMCISPLPSCSNPKKLLMSSKIAQRKSIDEI